MGYTFWGLFSVFGQQNPKHVLDVSNVEELWFSVINYIRLVIHFVHYCNTFSGSSIGVKCAVIVGGMDMMSQALTLAKKPHILIATPGRLVDHLENTKGFSLRALKFLVSFMSVSKISTHLFQIGVPLLHISCY